MVSVKIPPDRFRLIAPQPAPAAPVWSDDQARVLARSSGALAVLGGPGTGKTTLLVEQVARRVAAGTPLEKLLVITHSRGAAQQLRARIVARVGGAHLVPKVTTVHGFCHNIVRRYAQPETWGIARLLSAPEQEFRLRELLAGHDRAGWPPEIAAAAETRAFASQLRAVLARARQLGYDPEDLRRFAVDDPAWGVVADFFEEYLNVLDFEGALDYAELVHRARLLLTEDDVRVGVSAELEAVFCDEFAELDPAQLALLGDLAGLGLDLVVYADPQQSIFRFRGADSVAAVDWFIERFGPDAVMHVQTNHRGGAELVSAWRGIATRLNAVNAPQESSPAPHAGVVRAVLYDDPAAELGHLADQLRAAHLRDGVAWRDCAVIARTGRSEVAPIARALRQAGVPVEVAGDEIALSEQLAVRPLVFALGLTLSDSVDADQAARLLTSPLGHLEPVELRALGRALREAARSRGEQPMSSAQHLAEALNDPSKLPSAPEAALVVRDLGKLIASARSDVAAGASVHRVVWRLWDGTGWPARLRAEAMQGDLRANADLDAVVELFELAASGERLLGERGVRAFLSEVAGQTIPADTARESDPRGRGVRVLTAHRAKGEQFARIFVVGVREGNWPRHGRLGSLLEPDTLTSNGPAAWTAASMIADERRGFYVACTRATEQLVVSGSCDGETERPSRFLTELGVTVQRVRGPANHRLTLPGLIGDLRQVACDPATSPALRQAAANRLALLAEQTDGRGHRLAPTADPARWWGMHDLSGGGALGQAQLRFTGSEVATILECPRRWFLARRARADQPGGAAAALGSVVHLLAQHALGTGEVTAAELHGRLHEIWDEIPFEAAWLSAAEKAEAEAALERLVLWQGGTTHRRVLGVEVPFTVNARIAGEDILLEGSVDRLELDDHDRLRVVDFKTSRTLPTAEQVARHEQLGVYQLAAQIGGFDEFAPGVRAVADAELVYLRGQTREGGPKVFQQASLDDRPRLDDTSDEHPTWVHARLAEAAKIVRTERFDALRCTSCRFCAFQRGCPALANASEVVS